MSAKDVKTGDHAPKAGTAAAAGVKRMNVTELLEGARELILVHERQEYRLRITSNGKLILTK